MSFWAAMLGAALIVTPAAATALECPLSKPAAAEDGYALAITLAPVKPTVGQPFQITVMACGPHGEAYRGPLTVDAEMPAHRHGMNYRPSVSSSDPGVFVARGFLLHMPGAWEFKFRLKGADGPVRLIVKHTQP